VTARTVRRIVVTLCVAGVAGLIVTSILDAQGAAVTIGLVTAAAVLCLIVATAVGDAPRPTAPTSYDEAQAEMVERLVGDLVATGADEAALRCLVREAVRLGRGELPQPSTRAADEEVWQQ
jgi:hypothetical protein